VNQKLARKRRKTRLVYEMEYILSGDTTKVARMRAALREMKEHYRTLWNKKIPS
jgi:hypothetical protein